MVLIPYTIPSIAVPQQLSWVFDRDNNLGELIKQNPAQKTENIDLETLGSYHNNYSKKKIYI